MSEDWLETPEDTQRSLVEDVLFDDTSPRDKTAVAPESLGGLYAKTYVALRGLRPQQRTFLRAYVQAGCNRSYATRLLKSRGLEMPNPGTVSRWFQEPSFRVALDGMKKMYMDTMGLDPGGTLMKAGRVYEEAMTPQPILHQGADTGYREVDLTNAMRAVEFLGRVNKLTTGDESSQRVTLQIINIADREQRDVVSEQ